MDIGRKISDLRQEKGLTQKELGHEIGVSAGAVGMWETGRREPDADTIERLADFFNISIDCLFGRERRSSDEVAVPEDAEELLEYYSALDKMSQRWIMGQLVDLLRRNEDEESVAAETPSSLKEVK